MSILCSANRSRPAWGILLGILLPLSTTWAQSDNDPKDGKNESKGQKSSQHSGQLASLEAMLAVALKHNPDVRAAEANVRSAEVELDRIRLEVVQKVIGFRQRRQSQQAAVRQAESELVAASAEADRLREVAGAVPTHSIHSAIRATERAKDNLAVQKVRLTELEAELPFLLGQFPVVSKPPDASRRLRNNVLTKARQLFELRQQSYRAGEATMLEVAAAQRQVLDLEARLADTKSKKIAVLDQHLKLLENLLEIVEAHHKAGQASSADVLAAELELAKLQLQLEELRGE